MISPDVLNSVMDATALLPSLASTLRMAEPRKMRFPELLALPVSPAMMVSPLDVRTAALVSSLALVPMSAALASPVLPLVPSDLLPAMSALLDHTPTTPDRPSANLAPLADSPPPKEPNSVMLAIKAHSLMRVLLLASLVLPVPPSALMVVISARLATQEPSLPTPDLASADLAPQARSLLPLVPLSASTVRLVHSPSTKARTSVASAPETPTPKLVPSLALTAPRARNPKRVLVHAPQLTVKRELRATQAVNRQKNCYPLMKHSVKSPPNIPLTTQLHSNNPISASCNRATDYKKKTNQGSPRPFTNPPIDFEELYYGFNLLNQILS